MSTKAEELADKITSPTAGPWDNLEAAAELCRLAEIERQYLALKAGFEQAITDPENQPSQYGTITLEAHAEKVLDISVKYDNAVSALISAREELTALKASIGEPVAWLVLSTNPDGSTSVEYAAEWAEAAHEHINDAITEYGNTEAGSWIVRPSYLIKDNQP